MQLTVILIIISFSSPTHSFIPGLKPSFSASPSHFSLSFSSSGLSTWFPRLYCYFWAYPFLLFSFSVSHFLVVGSVRYIKVTHVGFRAHVKIASRIVSYRIVSIRAHVEIAVRRRPIVPCMWTQLEWVGINKTMWIACRVRTAWWRCQRPSHHPVAAPSPGATTQ